MLIIAAISLGTAVARTSPRLRLHGIGYAVLIPAFAVSGFALQPIQAWTGIALAAVSAALAIRLPATITTNANLDGNGRKAGWHPSRTGHNECEMPPELHQPHHASITGTAG